jgi:uncharacterized protein (DUF2062 family)
MRRLRHAHGTPHEVALGFSVATYLSILPTPGLSIVAGFALSLVVPMSRVSLALGFAVFNPLVCVLLIYPWALPIGQALLRILPDFSLDGLPKVQWLAEAGAALILGAAVAGLLVAIPAYILIRQIVGAYRARRAVKRLAQGVTAEVDGE